MGWVDFEWVWGRVLWVGPRSGRGLGGSPKIGNSLDSEGTLVATSLLFWGILRVMFLQGSL